ncbi:glycosyltransferase family 1 protein [Shewanella sp. Isolate11]|uniref:glycosyltransferase family 4 protein n=1 Tax=Shewanella sp. Isolate11 TaxID=2908530 RepID=UPI001EFE8F66|nr:glycosyltransferase family 1 protein [Shewanella sp. Isolate11]MCG9697106.1 glycosyltransferase family 4 protein [Shewanella sp. Isolate11]
MPVINGRFINKDVSGVERFAIEMSERLNYRVVKPSRLFSKGILGHFWEQLYLPLYCFFYNELLICLCNTSPVLYRNKVIVLHDVFFVDFPQWYSFKFRFFYKYATKLTLNRTLSIFTVSEYSKKRISQVFNVAEDSITVLGNALPSDFESIQKNDITVSKEPFFLAVGVNQERKNFKGIISAFIEFKKKYKSNYKLVIVGGNGNNFNTDLDLVNDAELFKSDIVFTGRVDDESLCCYYQQCIAFLSLSHAEGFGIPVLEAMAFGAPVICSNNTAYPEVADDAAVMVDIYDESKIVEAMQNISTDLILREQLVKKGNKRYQIFKWEYFAKKMRGICEDSSC